MKQFDLVDALNGKPVCDREGNIVTNFRKRVPADTFCGAGIEYYPFLAESENGYAHSYTVDGVYSLVGKSSYDLFMVDEQSEDNREIALLRERLQKVEDLLGLKDDEEIDPYKELKDAVAQGKELQFKYSMTGKWLSLSDLNVGWWSWSWSYPPDHYRIKPETVKYRMYKWKSGHFNGTGFVENAEQECDASKRPEFVKWISDWIEMEL